ncbi:MAG: rhomboid family intramembrane serine protease [Proteobacteria bacterium]|nr:rhomboid family intramembrane serine protease [Pseudomonadota bacterium]
MHIDRPDPSGLNPQKDRSLFRTSLKIALLAAGLLWLLTLADQTFSLHFARFGLYPRKLSGLIGILFAPLIHSGWAHLLNNTLPLLVGLSSILYTYPQSSRRALLVIYIASSALAWIFARPSYHIGASGFIFGVLAFLFLSGMLRRDLRSIAVSMMIWFLYASMIWGVLPIREGTSWEMHLSGALVGIFMAFNCRSMDPVVVKKYSWEDEGVDVEDVPDWYIEAMKAETEEEKSGDK